MKAERYELQKNWRMLFYLFTGLQFAAFIPLGLWQALWVSL